MRLGQIFTICAFRPPIDSVGCVWGNTAWSEPQPVTRAFYPDWE